jgi:hypothetical protein
MAAQRKLIDRRKRFASSSRWHTDKSGSPRIVQNHVELCIVRDSAKYRLQMNGTTGKLEFDSVVAAKIKAFDLIDSDSVSTFLQKEQRRASGSAGRSVPTMRPRPLFESKVDD